MHKTRKASEGQSSLRDVYSAPKAPKGLSWRDELKDAVLHAVQENKSATFLVDANEMISAGMRAGSTPTPTQGLVDLVRCLHNLLLFGNPLDLWNLEDLMGLGIVTPLAGGGSGRALAKTNGKASASKKSTGLDSGPPLPSTSTPYIEPRDVLLEHFAKQVCLNLHVVVIMDTCDSSSSMLETYSSLFEK